MPLVRERPRGHRPDPPGVPKHLGAHLGAVLYGTSAPRRSVDNRQGVLDGPGIRTQRTNSCTGYATVGAIESQFALAGTPIEHKSPISPYDWGRLRELRAAFPDDPPSSLPKLTDVGAVPFYVVSGVAANGLAPWNDRLDDPATINDRPSIVEIVHADEFKLEGWSRLDDATSESERILQLQLAIDAGKYPAIALQVDQAFEDYTGGLYVPGGALLGGHDVYLAGYEPGFFWLVNHWSEGWGEGGFARMPERCATDWSDLYVLNPQRVA